MALKHGILGFLIYGVSTGYELNKTFKDSVDNFWHATSSQIYRELDWLEAHGMACSEVVIQNGKPNKKTFQITDKGRETFAEWLAASEEEPFTFRSSFLMRVFFSGLRSRTETIQMLQLYIEQCERYFAGAEEWDRSIDHYGEDDSRNPLYWELTSDYGRRHLKMSVEWAQESIKKLTAQEDELK